MSDLEQLRQLVAVTQALASTRDAETVCRLVVEVAVALAPAETAAVLLEQPEGASRLVAFCGRQITPDGLNLPLEDALAHYRNLLRVEPRDQFLCFDLAHGSQRGLLIVHQQRKRVRSRVQAGTAKTLLTALAAHAAAALDRIYQLEQARRDLEAAASVEAQLRGLIDAAPDALVILGSDRLIQLVNAQAETLFGYSREELLEQPIEMLMPERFRSRHTRHVARYFTDPQVRPMGAGLELYGRHKLGAEFPIEISLSPLETSVGRLALGAIRDVTERRKADDRFRGLLEAAPDPMVITDAGGRIILVNQELEREFGYLRAELLGQPVEVLLPERLRDQHVRRRSGYQSTPRTRPMGLGMELLARRKDGHEFPVEISLSPLEAEEGLLITSSIRDVTERKRFVEALRQSEERFRAAFDHSPIAMAMVDLDGRFLRINRAFTAFIGYSESELLTRHFAAISHPDDLPADLALLQRLLADEFPTFSLEKRYYHRQGQLRWGLLNVSVVRDREGQPLHFIRQIEDVTERRWSEDELRRHTATLREQTQLIELAHDAVIVRDLEGRIVLWNCGAEQTYGYSPEEVRGLVTHALLRTRFHSKEEVDATLLLSGSWEGELVHTTRSGDILVVASRQVLQRDEGGNPRAILEINRDITQQKLAEVERSRLLASERQKSEQLTLAIREAHHRIKNNLQAITDLLSLELYSLPDPGNSESLRDSIERIGAIALVHDFLTRDENLESVEINRVIERLVPMVLSTGGLPPHSVELSVQAAPLLLPSKQATTFALLVNELVSNAVKHAFAVRRGGRLQVQLTRQEGVALLVVQDDGPGLPADFDFGKHANVGLQVVDTLVRGSLNGQVLLSGGAGMCAEVRFPVDVVRGRG